MTHPLTDEMCELIADTLDRPFTLIERENMRTAADWQLERDAEYFAEYLTTVLGWDPVIAQMRTETFKKAMRPQEDN